MTETQKITGPWRVISRIAWIVITATLIALFVLGAPERFAVLTTPCAPPDCHDFLVPTAQEAAVLADWGIPLSSYAILQIGYEVFLSTILTILGALIYWRRPNERISFVVSLALVCFGLNFLTEGDGALVAALNAPWLTVLVTLMTFLTAFFFLLMVFLFPNGRFVPSWMRYLAPVYLLLFLGLTILSLITGNTAFVSFADIGSTMALFTGVFLGLGAQVHRYLKVSTPIERQQTRWVMFGLVMVALAMVTWSASSAFLPNGEPRVLVSTVGMFIMVLMLLIFPVTLTISIVRYRLWDIDALINRAMVYFPLTALLAGVYFGLVLVTQNTFVAITGQQSTLAIVISTLAIAALFTPARRRVQAFVDRRFYRQKYDAVRTLESFADAVRDEVDIDDVRAELLRAVNETMQPEAVSLWLREGIE